MANKIQSEELNALDELKNTYLRGIEAVEERIITEKMRLIKEHFGAEIGTTVVSSRTGEEHKISSFDLEYTTAHKPWVKAHKKNKNGEWSKSIVWLMDNWELPE